MARFDRVIPPGQEGHIEAMVDTSHYNGPINKALNVKTNDPDHPMAVLQLSATVKAYVEVLPSWQVNFVADQGQAAQQVLYLKGLDASEPLDVTGAGCDNPHLKVTVARLKPTDPDAGKGEFRATVELQPDAPIGPVTGTITFTTTLERQRTVEVALNGRVNGPIGYFPLQIVMFKDASGRPPRLTGTIVLQTRQGAPPMKPGKIETGDARLLVERLTDPATGVFRLGLKWTAPDDKGTFNGTVSIETGIQSMPRIEIPYQVRIE